MKPAARILLPNLLLLTLTYVAGSKFEGEPEPELEPEYLETFPERHPKIIAWENSVEGLQYLAENELEMYRLMREIKTELATKLQQVTSWLHDYEESSLKTAYPNLPESQQPQIVDEIVSHPLMALRMIRRYVGVRNNLLAGPAQSSALQLLDRMESKYFLPDDMNYENAMENTLNLRYIYGLNVNDLMNGYIYNVQTNVGLSPEQVHEMGLYAEKRRAYTEALSWLQPLTLLKYPNSNSTPVSVQAQADMDRISKKHDELLDTIPSDNFWDFPHRFTTKILGNTDTTKLITQTEHVISNPQKYHTTDPYFFSKACRGLMTKTHKSKLICFYETKLHPSWTINPLKIEVHSWRPYLIRVYDVLNDTVIEYLRKLSQPQLTAATILNIQYNNESGSSQASIIENTVDEARVASYAFLLERSPILRDLEFKIGRMTGLEVANTDPDQPASEPIQIASYAHGGHYNFHIDSGFPETFPEAMDDDRIATFMIYLSDVQLGGATVFPAIGLSIEPIKKSAVFWYNLLKNGDVDGLTVHGGCPVILGHKWISNTWIHSSANFQKRKCSLNPNE